MAPQKGAALLLLWSFRPLDPSMVEFLTRSPASPFIVLCTLSSRPVLQLRGLTHKRASLSIEGFSFPMGNSHHLKFLFFLPPSIVVPPVHRTEFFLRVPSFPFFSFPRPPHSELWRRLASKKPFFSTARRPIVLGRKRS